MKSVVGVAWLWRPFQGLQEACPSVGSPERVLSLLQVQACMGPPPPAFVNPRFKCEPLQWGHSSSEPSQLLDLEGDPGQNRSALNTCWLFEGMDVSWKCQGPRFYLVCTCDVLDMQEGVNQAMFSLNHNSYRFKTSVVPRVLHRRYF